MVLGPGLVLGQSPILRDLILYFQPWTEYACRHVAAGEYPLWNPLVYCGTSWAGQSQGRVLYPTFPLYLALPYRLAALLDLAVHLAAGVVCAFLLARRLGIGTAGALYGALAAVANGWMLAKLEAPLKVAIVALAPLAMLGFAYAREGRARLGAVLLGVAVALQLLNGYPPLSVYVIPAELAAGFALLVAGAPRVSGESRRRAAWLPLAGRMACAVAAGALIACAAVVPFLADVRDTAYMKPLPAELAAARSLAPAQALGAVLPRWVGMPGSDRYWGGELSVYTAGALYVGLPAAAFALIAVGAALARARSHKRSPPGGDSESMDDRAHDLSRARRAFVIALALVALGALLVGLGRYGFLFEWLRRVVPAYASTRWPSQSLCVVALALGLLAGFGIEVIERHVTRARVARARRSVAFAGGAFAVVLAVLSVAPGIDGAALWLLDTSILPHQQDAFAAHAEDFLRGDLRRAALITAASAFVIAFPPRVWMLLAVILSADLALLGRSLVPYTREDLFAPDAALGSLADVRDRDERILRVGSDLAMEVAVYGARNPLVLREASRGLSAATPLLYDLAAADGADPMQSARHAYLVGALTRAKTPDAIRERIASVLGVGAFVQAVQSTPDEIARITAIADTITYRRASIPPVPFAYLVESVEAIAGDDAQIRRLASPEFEPLRAAVVAAPIAGYALDAPAGAASETSAVAPQGVDAAGGDASAGATPRARSCSYERPRPERIRVSIDTPADALLVVRESHHRDWRTRVDDRPRQIVRSNVLFMGVPVHAGERSVELEFAPSSVRSGFALSFAGVALLAAVALVRTARREAPPSAAPPPPPSPRGSC